MINYAILGLLSWKPQTAYDLKQTFHNSLIMYCSGSKNLTYRTLIKLYEENQVTYKVENIDSGSTRKIFTITPKGKDVLRRWLLSQPDLPDIKNSFLIRVAWADQLSDEELDAILAKYQEEVNFRWIMQNEFMEREADNFPNRTEREKLLWEGISKYWIATFERELSWVQTLRADLKKLSTQNREVVSDIKPYKFQV